VTCAWDGWKYCVRNGMSAHKGGDSVNSYEVKVVDKNKLYVAFPHLLAIECFSLIMAYVDLETSVKVFIMHMSKDNTLPIDSNNRKTRNLGISTTNANDKMAPRKST
jgi:hypothetical protein